MAKTINKAAFMKTASPTEMATLLGHDDGGKKVRARLRANGIRLSKGGKFDAKAHNLLWGIFVEGKKQAAKAKTTKAKSTKTRSKKATAPKPETAPAE